jgi:hypothetical protein
MKKNLFSSGTEFPSPHHENVHESQSEASTLFHTEVNNWLLAPVNLPPTKRPTVVRYKSGWTEEPVWTL